MVMRFLIPVLLLAAMTSCAMSPGTRDESDWRGVEITGRLADEDGSPVKKGYVYAYAGSRRSILGPADAMSEPSDENGFYTLVVPAGVYRLVARKRLSGALGGPLRDGDLIGKMPAPVEAKSHAARQFDFSMRVFHQGLEGDPSKIIRSDTRIQGMVRDQNGAPIAGAHAFAYTGEMSKDPPDYLSDITGADGRFSLHLPGGGIYTIGARTGLRGRPRAGDLRGFLGGTPSAVQVEKGRGMDGVEVILVPFGEGGTSDAETR